MKYISVFCGAAEGKEKIYSEQAFLLGKTIAERKYGIIYGGAHVGLMGAVANGALDNGGEVIGVLPRFLAQKELAHPRLVKNYIVDTMHERKAKMNELCDAVIALPGGFGTMEELFEMLTWGQLALHSKPVALLNTLGYYDPLISFVDRMIDNHFLKEEYRQMILIDDDINILLDKMAAYTPQKKEKWFEPR